jgi:hypothetical protein
MSSRRQPTKSTLTGVFALVFAFLATFAMVAADRAEAANPCTPGNTYTANVVLFDTPMVFNRLGAQNPNWMMYALARDVIQVDPATGLPVPGFVPSSDLTVLQPGAVTLRPDKRPRPLVLRIPEDSCLEINFKNLLDPVPNPFNPAPPNVPNALPVDIVDINPALINNNQVVGRYAGVHVQGMQLVSSDTGNAIDADGSNVGAQGVIGAAAIKSGVVDHGQTIRYTLYAEHEGAFLLTNQGATFGGEASGGNVGVGDFGTVIVQPKGARIYRSAVTEEEFRLDRTTRFRVIF